MFVRYLIAGTFNTLFGYGMFAALNFAFSGHYIQAAILANLASITVAFVNYKWFVFRTRGNYRRELMRCTAVYALIAFMGITGLWAVVPAIRATLGLPTASPYIGAALITGATSTVGFKMHRGFSFRP